MCLFFMAIEENREMAYKMQGITKMPPDVRTQMPSATLQSASVSHGRKWVVTTPPLDGLGPFHLQAYPTQNVCSDVLGGQQQPNIRARHFSVIGRGK